MTDLTIDGETFRVEIEGASDRPCVLLSSSLGVDLTLWDAQVPALLEHFRVVRYDPRGHGGTTALGAPFSLARLGADALAILDALEIETTHFIGISMGGAVGQWLLANAPERISRAVLANTNARFGAPETWNARIAAALSKGTESLAAATMERWFSADFRETQPGRVAAVEAVFRATSREGYAACCAALRDMDLRAALHAVERPVLIVTGRDDAVASEADIAAMTGAIRGARHVAFHCRHISNIEAEAAFNQAVVDFLTARIPARVVRPRPARKHAAPARRPTTGRATAARRPLKAAAPDAAGKRARKPAAAATPAGASRTATKRTQTKAAPKAAAPKKAALEKAALKKAPGKTARKTTTKTAARKTASRTPTRTAVAEKVAPRKAAPKKAASKKATSKKAVPKKSATAKRRPLKKVTSARRRPGKAPRRPGGPRKR